MRAMLPPGGPPGLRTSHYDGSPNDGGRPGVKRFNCGEVVAGCTWTAQGEADEALFEQITAHARDEHGMDEVPPEIVDVIRGKIREV